MGDKKETDHQQLRAVAANACGEGVSLSTFRGPTARATAGSVYGCCIAKNRGEVAPATVFAPTSVGSPLFIPGSSLRRANYTCLRHLSAAHSGKFDSPGKFDLPDRFEWSRKIDLTSASAAVPGATA